MAEIRRKNSIHAKVKKSPKSLMSLEESGKSEKIKTKQKLKTGNAIKSPDRPSTNRKIRRNNLMRAEWQPSKTVHFLIGVDTVENEIIRYRIDRARYGNSPIRDCELVNELPVELWENSRRLFPNRKCDG
jgi:hypothetical protein